MNIDNIITGQIWEFCELPSVKVKISSVSTGSGTVCDNIFVTYSRGDEYYTRILNEFLSNYRVVENHISKEFIDMVAIPGGKFIMGDEKPQHQVTVQPFFMAKFQVTQAQYQEIIGKNPSNFKGGNRPVEGVSWDDAVEFCKKLSKQTGQKYRLPTEAEWEYACRAGTTTKYSFGDKITDKLSNYNSNIDETTVVGQYPPNAFGLYDMHGNVWEWCEDDWHSNYENAPTDSRARFSKTSSNKVIRGGSWTYDPGSCRSAYRDHDSRDSRLNSFGVRVVCEEV